MILYENTVNQFLNSCLNKKMFSYVIDELEKHYDKNLTISYTDYKTCIYEIMIFVMNNNVNKDCGIRIDYINDENNSRLAFIFASKNDNKTNIGLVEMYPIVDIKPTNDSTAVLASNSLNQESATIVEPYMQSLAYIKYLFKNNFDDYCDCYAIPFLYDCSKENGYSDDDENKEFTYAYAGEYEKIEERIKNVICDGNGIEALKYIHSKDNLPFNHSDNLNDFYSYIFYLINQDKKANRNSLYLVKSYVEVLFDKDSQDYIKKENINVLINDFSFEKINKNGCTVFFYYELDDESKRSIIEFATKNNIAVKQLDANAYLNYEEELNYLAKFIDKTDDGSLENLYVMNNYDVIVVDNENELVDIPGYAKIGASKDVYYNKEEQIIINWNLLFKPLVKSFVNGDKGVYLYVADDGLRQHLKQEIQKIKTDEENFQKIADIAKNDGDINAILNSVGNQTKESATQIIINSLGNECWSKLCEDSKLSLISGYLVLESLKKCDKTADFSGSCLQICKAVEYELTSRYVTEYIKYIKDKYNEEALNKAPYALLKEQKNDDDPKEFIDPDFATLGNFRFVMGLQSNGDIANKYAWNEFEDYAKNKLLKDTTNTQETLSEHISYIIKIKNDYRNRSAHKNFMDLTQGIDCYNYIIGDLKKLSRILDSYKF